MSTTLNWPARSIIASLALVLAACPGPSGGPDVPDEQGEPADVAGTWQLTWVTGETDADERPSWERTGTISQDGNSVTITEPHGGNFSGTIQGRTLTLTGSFPYDGSSVQVHSLVATVSSDLMSAEGKAEWTWSNGEDSHSGNATVSGRRSSPPPKPTDPPKKDGPSLKDYVGKWHVEALVMDVEHPVSRQMIGKKLGYQFDIRESSGGGLKVRVDDRDSTSLAVLDEASGNLRFASEARYSAYDFAEKIAILVDPKSPDVLAGTMRITVTFFSDPDDPGALECVLTGRKVN